MESWVLNITFHVAEKRNAEFLEWLRSVMIPALKKYGNGVRYGYCLEIMLELPDDNKGYAVHMHVDTFEHLNDFSHSVIYRTLNMSLSRHFGYDVVAFNTPMRIVEP